MAADSSKQAEQVNYDFGEWIFLKSDFIFYIRQ